VPELTNTDVNNPRSDVGAAEGCDLFDLQLGKIGIELRVAQQGVDAKGRA